jgi:hypothetical protein
VGVRREDTDSKPYSRFKTGSGSPDAGTLGHSL